MNPRSYPHTPYGGVTGSGAASRPLAGWVMGAIGALAGSLVLFVIGIVLWVNATESEVREFGGSVSQTNEVQRVFGDIFIFLAGMCRFSFLVIVGTVVALKTYDSYRRRERRADEVRGLGMAPAAPAPNQASASTAGLYRRPPGPLG